MWVTTHLTSPEKPPVVESILGGLQSACPVIHAQRSAPAIAEGRIVQAFPETHPFVTIRSECLRQRSWPRHPRACRACPERDPGTPRRDFVRRPTTLQV